MGFWPPAIMPCPHVRRLSEGKGRGGTSVSSASEYAGRRHARPRSVEAFPPTPGTCYVDSDSTSEPPRAIVEYWLLLVFSNRDVLRPETFVDHNYRLEAFVNRIVSRDRDS